MEGKTQETAAAKAGMSVRSARKWQSGPLPSATKPEHWWRTRPDPFDWVWEDEIEPLLRNDPVGKLKATTIIAHRKASEQASGQAVDQLRQGNIFRLLKLEHAIFRHPQKQAA